MLTLPTPATTSPKKGGAAGGVGRLLLMAALDVPKRGQGSASPTSPASPSPRSPRAASSSPMRARSEGLEDGEEDSQAEPDAESKHAFGWYLIRSALNGLRSPTKESVEDSSPCSPMGRRYSLDLMESMEEGHAHELPTDFVVPLRRSSKLWRFRVLRSEDNLSCRLLTDAGDFLMYAAIRLEAHRADFHLYDPNCHKELFNQERPAFTMSYNGSKDTWRLVQERCSACQYLSPSRSCAAHGKQQMAVIKHKQHVVGEGISNIMEVIIPGLYQDDTCVVWCPMLGMGDLADAEAGNGESQTLITRKPVWNEQVQSLVLDFKGRNIVSSAKNFQLALRQKPQHVICQYGKLSPTNFGLDFRYPLSVIQAFGAAVSTIFWT